MMIVVFYLSMLKITVLPHQFSPETPPSPMMKCHCLTRSKSSSDPCNLTSRLDKERTNWQKEELMCFAVCLAQREWNLRTQGKMCKPFSDLFVQLQKLAWSSLIALNEWYQCNIINILMIKGVVAKKVRSLWNMANYADYQNAVTFVQFLI